jgi:hypothetical protein
MNYKLQGEDPSNPTSHVLIEVDGRIFSVIVGTEDATARQVLGLPMIEPEPVQVVPE